MYMVDFKFGDELLSSHGFIPCGINTSKSDSVQMGSTLTLNTVKMNGTSTNGLINTSYNDVLTATFDICKNPCDSNDLTISDIEMRTMMTWLMRKEYQVFKPIFDDGSWSNTYFKGTFTSVEAIYKGNLECIGFTVKLETNAPWGFCEYPTKKYSAVTTFSINSADMTDEVGFLHPINLVIKTNAAGNLYLRNSLDADGRYTIVKNLVKDEIITMNCEAKTITTNKSTHSKFYNDFNFNFPRIIHNYDKSNCSNVFTLYSGEGTGSLSCDVTMDFAPIRKVGVLV